MVFVPKIPALAEAKVKIIVSLSSSRSSLIIVKGKLAVVWPEIIVPVPLRVSV